MLLILIYFKTMHKRQPTYSIVLTSYKSHFHLGILRKLSSLLCPPSTTANQTREELGLQMHRKNLQILQKVPASKGRTKEGLAEFSNRPVSQTSLPRPAPAQPQPCCLVLSRDGQGAMLGCTECGRRRWLW